MGFSNATIEQVTAAIQALPDAGSSVESSIDGGRSTLEDTIQEASGSKGAAAAGNQVLPPTWQLCYPLPVLLPSSVCGVPLRLLPTEPHLLARPPARLPALPACRLSLTFRTTGSPQP